MLKGILDYIPTKKKERLVQQWVENAGLPEEEVRPGLREERPQEEDLTLRPIEQENACKSVMSISIEQGMVSLPLKYVLLGISVITLQLVLLSIFFTVIIMQP